MSSDGPSHVFFYRLVPFLRLPPALSAFSAMRAFCLVLSTFLAALVS